MGRYYTTRFMKGLRTNTGYVGEEYLVCTLDLVYSEMENGTIPLDNDTQYAAGRNKGLYMPVANMLGTYPETIRSSIYRYLAHIKGTALSSITWNTPHGQLTWTPTVDIISVVNKFIEFVRMTSPTICEALA